MPSDDRKMRNSTVSLNSAATMVAADARPVTRRMAVFMQELIDSLDNCIRQSTFVSNRIGKIGWADYRRLFRERRWGDTTWMHWAASELEVNDALVADLAAKLDPVLAKFIHPETGRFGNGLFRLWGGPMRRARPTVAEFARTLITAAARVGAAEVVALLVGWAAGEPLRFRISSLLEGAIIDEDLHLAEGIRLSKLPTSGADIPASLPPFLMGATVFDVIGGIVMSIDCEMSPALYLPEDDESGEMLEPRGQFVLASGQVPNLSENSFCESISLASNGYVDWFLQWRDFASLEAFTDVPSGTSHKVRSGARGTKVSQAGLDDALKIHRARHDGSGPKENLELAMNRWIRSKRPGTNLDKLIDLRIALEALYEIGGDNEKAFRIATYGAWHLGETFQKRLEIRETLRKAYRDSSSAVHAGKLKYAAKEPDLVSSAQNVCRDGILKRLQETTRPKWEEIILGVEE